MNIRNGLVLTTAVAAALSVAGCSSNEPQAEQGWTTDQPTAVCTDQQGRRVDDDLCDDDDNASSGGGGFMFLYLSSGSHVPRYGAPVKGGSKMKAPGQSYSPSKSVPAARGGLGASSRGGGGFSSGS